uniref:SRCR domain-containing protein n=1 Tax=Macrostomum lignano TaxID=282301 RepID=A0A1I8J240_9PLAT
YMRQWAAMPIPKQEAKSPADAEVDVRRRRVGERPYSTAAQAAADGQHMCDTWRQYCAGAASSTEGSCLVQRLRYKTHMPTWRQLQQRGQLFSDDASYRMAAESEVHRGQVAADDANADAGLVQRQPALERPLGVAAKRVVAGREQHARLRGGAHSWRLFHNEVEILTNLLSYNGYPKNFVMKIVNSFLNDKLTEPNRMKVPRGCGHSARRGLASSGALGVAVCVLGATASAKLADDDFDRRSRRKRQRVAGHPLHAPSRHLEWRLRLDGTDPPSQHRVADLDVPLLVDADSLRAGRAAGIASFGRRLISSSAGARMMAEPLVIVTSWHDDSLVPNEDSIHRGQLLLQRVEGPYLGSGAISTTALCHRYSRPDDSSRRSSCRIPMKFAHRVCQVNRTFEGAWQTRRALSMRFMDVSRRSVKQPKSLNTLACLSSFLTMSSTSVDGRLCISDLQYLLAGCRWWPDLQDVHPSGRLPANYGDAFSFDDVKRGDCMPAGRKWGRSSPSCPAAACRSDPYTNSLSEVACRRGRCLRLSNVAPAPLSINTDSLEPLISWVCRLLDPKYAGVRVVHLLVAGLVLQRRDGVGVALRASCLDLQAHAKWSSFAHFLRLLPCAAMQAFAEASPSAQAESGQCSTDLSCIVGSLSRPIFSTISSYTLSATSGFSIIKRMAQRKVFAVVSVPARNSSVTAMASRVSLNSSGRISWKYGSSEARREPNTSWQMMLLAAELMRTVVSMGAPAAASIERCRWSVSTAMISSAPRRPKPKSRSVFRVNRRYSRQISPHDNATDVAEDTGCKCLALPAAQLLCIVHHCFFEGRPSVKHVDTLRAKVDANNWLCAKSLVEGQVHGLRQVAQTSDHGVPANRWRILAVEALAAEPVEAQSRRTASDRQSCCRGHFVFQLYLGKRLLTATSLETWSPLLLPSPRVPVLSSRAAVLSSRAVLLSPRAAVLSSRAVLLSSRAAVLFSRAVLLSSKAAVLSPRVAVLSSRAADEDLRTDAVVQHADELVVTDFATAAGVQLADHPLGQPLGRLSGLTVPHEGLHRHLQLLGADEAVAILIQMPEDRLQTGTYLNDGLADEGLGRLETFNQLGDWESALLVLKAAERFHALPQVALRHLHAAAGVDAQKGLQLAAARLPGRPEWLRAAGLLAGRRIGSAGAERANISQPSAAVSMSSVIPAWQFTWQSAATMPSASNKVGSVESLRVEQDDEEDRRLAMKLIADKRLEALDIVEGYELIGLPGEMAHQPAPNRQPRQFDARAGIKSFERLPKVTAEIAREILVAQAPQKCCQSKQFLWDMPITKVENTLAWHLDRGWRGGFQCGCTGAAGRVVWPPHSSPSTELGHERRVVAEAARAPRSGCRRRRGREAGAEGSRAPMAAGRRTGAERGCEAGAEGGGAPGGRRRQQQQGARRAPKAAGRQAGAEGGGAPGGARRQQGARRAPMTAGRQAGADGSRASGGRRRQQGRAAGPHPRQSTYCLETYVESRFTCWSYEPFSGQKLDSPNEGKAPGPWEVELRPREMFVDQDKELIVPHTSTVTPCHHCNAKGKTVCHKCRGKKLTRCGDCGGHGRKTVAQGAVLRKVDCGECDGQGKRRCPLCSGSGEETCTTCSGHQQLVFAVKLKCEWRGKNADYIEERTDLPDELVRDVTGKVIFEEEGELLTPISNFPISPVNRASKSLIGAHENSLKGQRVLRQRHNLRGIPVTEVHYEHEGRQGVFFVYGFENKLFAQGLPSGSCCSLLAAAPQQPQDGLKGAIIDLPAEVAGRPVADHLADLGVQLSLHLGELFFPPAVQAVGHNSRRVVGGLDIICCPAAQVRGQARHLGHVAQQPQHIPHQLLRGIRRSGVHAAAQFGSLSSVMFHRMLQAELRHCACGAPAIRLGGFKQFWINCSARVTSRHSQPTNCRSGSSKEIANRLNFVIQQQEEGQQEVASGQRVGPPAVDGGGNDVQAAADCVEKAGRAGLQVGADEVVDRCGGLQEQCLELFVGPDEVLHDVEQAVQQAQAAGGAVVGAWLSGQPQELEQRAQHDGRSLGVAGELAQQAGKASKAALGADAVSAIKAIKAAGRAKQAESKAASSADRAGAASARLVNDRSSRRRRGSRCSRRRRRSAASAKGNSSVSASGSGSLCGSPMSSTSKSGNFSHRASKPLASDSDSSSRRAATSVSKLYVSSSSATCSRDLCTVIFASFSEGWLFSQLKCKQLTVMSSESARNRATQRRRPRQRSAGICGAASSCAAVMPLPARSSETRLAQMKRTSRSARGFESGWAGRRARKQVETGGREVEQGGEQLLLSAGVGLVPKAGRRVARQQVQAGHTSAAEQGHLADGGGSDADGLVRHLAVVKAGWGEPAHAIKQGQQQQLGPQLAPVQPAVLPSQRAAGLPVGVAGQQLPGAQLHEAQVWRLRCHGVRFDGVAGIGLGA